MAETVVVHGHRELIKALRTMDKDVAKGIREELRSAGQIVQREAASLLAPVSPRSAAGYRVRVRQRGVAVEQSIGRTTGEHPEFGALQMREALLPSLERRAPDVERKLESMLDSIIVRLDLQ
jgi:hypothetical protein